MVLYICNVPYASTEEDFQKLFGSCGKVVRVRIPLDRESGRPRGIAFVEMGNEEEGRRAIAELNGVDMGGRKISVTESNSPHR